MGVNKAFIDYIVENIGDILEHPEVRKAIVDYDTKKKAEEEIQKLKMTQLKQAKIDLAKQKNDVIEYKKRYSETDHTVNINLFFEDVLMIYIYILKTKNIEPEVITRGEIDNFCGTLQSYFIGMKAARKKHVEGKDVDIEKVVCVYLNFDDMRMQEFYQRFNQFFKRIQDDDTEILNQLTISDIGSLYLSILPTEVYHALTDEGVRNKVVEIFKGIHKTYKFEDKKNS